VLPELSVSAVLREKQVLKVFVVPKAQRARQEPPASAVRKAW
jgi:hypothetical protein